MPSLCGNCCYDAVGLWDELEQQEERTERTCHMEWGCSTAAGYNVLWNGHWLCDAIQKGFGLFRE